MKKFLLFVFAGILHLSLSAQLYRSSEFLLGGAVGYSYPVGDFADVSHHGFSGSLVGRWLLNEQIGVGFEAGYSLFGKDDAYWNVGNRGEIDVNYQLIPLLLNGTYIFKAWDRDFKPYASVAFGYFLFRNHVDFNSVNSEPVPYNSDPSLEYTIKENKVGVVPSLGFMYYLSDYLAFDMNLRYTYVPNFSKMRDVKQKFTNVSEGFDKYRIEENYSLGFDKISSLALNVGLLYRF
ncbi:MAG: hypothetical protein ACEPOZ_06635 [Marinifilaceae bacterium]